MRESCYFNNRYFKKTFQEKEDEIMKVMKLSDALRYADECKFIAIEYLDSQYHVAYISADSTMLVELFPVTEIVAEGHFNEFRHQLNRTVSQFCDDGWEVDREEEYIELTHLSSGRVMIMQYAEVR